MSEIVEDINVNQNNIYKIFGNLDSNVQKIEKKYNVKIINRDSVIKIIGEKNNVLSAKNIILHLNKLADNNEIINNEDVNYILTINTDNELNKHIDIDNEIILKTYLGKPIKSKTINQHKYVNSINENMITFGIGPAGTGKTFLAICMACKLFKSGDVQRIILTRPAIEAGEKLGFLPGDLQSKIDPYLRPLYDALFTIIGPESFNQNIEKGLIEVVPLAYMRGRTLDNAFIVLDEAQNTTFSQMKMFLTRIGFNSKVVVTGDITQIDLPKDTKSGLITIQNILKNISGINFIKLTIVDIVRHPLIQKIVNAYEKYESKK